MCGRCEDSKENVSNNVNISTRRTFLVFLLFSVTLSALGISCFALLTVQNLSRDLDSLRLVLKRTQLEPKKHPYGVDDEHSRNLEVLPMYVKPRMRRNLDAEQIKLNDFETAETTTEPGTSTFSPPEYPTTAQQEVQSRKKPASYINRSETPDVEIIPEFQSSKRENFTQTNEKNKHSSIGNVKPITNVEETKTIPNPLKKEVEFLNHTTDTTKLHPLFPSTHSFDISPIMGEIQPQGDHHIKKKAVDDEDDVESFTPEYKVPHKVHRTRQRGRNGNQLEIIDEYSPQAGRLKSLIAIHFDGDTSQYMLGVHTNYRGNGHLRHAQKTFIDWKISDWVETISATNSFHLRNGVVTVKASGLYFIYAQIYYLDEHDSNGYLILRNSEKLLQCKVTAPSSERQLKGNTCYTGGVAFLDKNDKISIDDISDGRFTLFVPGYSFFGLVKLGDVEGK